MRPSNLFTIAILLFFLSLPSGCAPFDPVGDGMLGSPAIFDECKDCSPPQLLAHHIDLLEKAIDKYGSIVPKRADVWGQARLMMHRQEFEREMKADLCKFNPSFQAAISTSDQAFLAQAFALQSVAGAQGGGGDAANLINDKDAIVRESLNKVPAYSPLANGKLAIEPTLIEDQKKRYLNHLQELRRINEGDDATDAPGYTINLMSIPISVLSGDYTQTGFGAECTITATPHLTNDLLPKTIRDLVINDLVDLLGLQITKVIEELPNDDAVASISKRVTEFEAAEYKRAAGEADDDKLEDLEQKFELELERLKVTKALFAAQNPPLRPGKRRPIQTSQLLTYLGGTRVLRIALALRSQIAGHKACNDRILYLDVQSALREELNAAYDFMSSETWSSLWELSGPELVEATRAADYQKFLQLYYDFAIRLPEPSSKSPPTSPLMVALAWPILLDATLLNAQFLEDMRNTQTTKGCPCLPDGWIPLCVPRPSEEACQIFNDYVRCRWPLRVFALDPETEDQNVTDSFRLRREMQLALSLAFTSGKIGANSFTRYTRRIEQDIDTIAINRTQIGFSHGDNTFGWRFYPRVQTPPIDGNLQAIFRDLLIGGRGPQYYLHRRRLENGIRNCVALVIMPSFVPSLDLEVTANWFRLAHPKHKALTLSQTLQLSQEVQQLQNVCAGTPDTGQYRPGDLGLVAARVEQLSQRLPLQHQLVDVPFENTHGGFDLLSTGVTDLGPELVGWYGAPGINPDGDTTIFLVGNNFSVHQTRVIVGGRFLDQSCPVSCQANTPAAPRTCKQPPSKKDDAAKEDSARTLELIGFGRCADCSAQDANKTAPRENTDNAAAKAGNAASKPSDAEQKPSETAPKPNEAPAATCGAGVPQTFQVELLSRQVMRVVVPKGVYFKGRLVDIHIATPYGVSPALQVPILGGAANKPAPAAVEVLPAPAIPTPAPCEEAKLLEGPGENCCETSGGPGKKSAEEKTIDSNQGSPRLGPPRNEHSDIHWRGIRGARREGGK